MERHLLPGKLCRPAGFRFADFSAPDPSGLVHPYRGCFAVLSALIRSLLLGSPLRAELSFSLPKPFPQPCVRQSLICYGCARSSFFPEFLISRLKSVISAPRGHHPEQDQELSENRDTVSFREDIVAVSVHLEQ